MTLFRTYKLEDLLKAIFSGGTPSTTHPEYWNGEFPWLSSGETNQPYISKTEKTITQEGINQSSTRFAPPGAVVMASAGQGKTRGQTSFLKIGVYINQSIIAMVPDETQLLAKYLYYNLQFRYDELRSSSDSSSTRGSITTELLKTLKITIPDLPTQEKIASILSAYDDAIENNNKRIKILEKMAENLYREWFVRMRFPGHETGEYENGLPKGWKRGRLDSFYKTTSGGTPSRSNNDFFLTGTIPWIKTGELRDTIILDTEEKITDLAVKKSAAKMIPANSLLMAMYGVNIGYLGITCMNSTCNQACCVFLDKQDISTLNYLFHYLKSIREYLFLIGFGAAQQNLSQDLIKRIKIIMPSEKLIRSFEQQQNITLKNIQNLFSQNRNLAQQRNLLLPRLISNKIVRVAYANKENKNQ